MSANTRLGVPNMSRRLAFAGAAAAFIAVVAIAALVFGGGGLPDPARHGFCALDTDFAAEAAADPVGFDQQMATSAGQQRLGEALSGAPDAVAAEVRVVVEAIRERGHQAFDDPKVAAAADRVEAWKDRFCQVVTTTTFPFPVGNVPGVPFECPPGFVRVEGMSDVYEELLEHLQMTGQWADTSEAEAFLQEQIPRVEGFEGMGGVTCLPADMAGDVDPDEITEHLEQYFPEGYDFGE